MILGYARVSTNDQNPALQIDALKRYGCERVFEEKVSAASKVRPQLERLLDSLREGDKVVVWRLDRLGRSIKDLIGLVELFKARGIQFVSLTESIDTSSPAGELIFHIFASVAQFERSLIIERTKSGLNAARARGRVGGRKPKLSPEDVKKARALALSNEISMGEIAEHFKVSRTTLYKYLDTKKD
ncbi:DNA invertase [Rheinheimera sp. KL1]|uniref:recombinase family protein n=1 Tax=Rheinheimera sp. KL1 TaxID=1635005 RepID=UPI0006A9B987|nr:recombinase family protein [Rheinheimera sp. KL1]KOO59216.1 DNA invertase [Rheinheimera sp. KL1]